MKMEAIFHFLQTVMTLLCEGMLKLLMTTGKEVF